MKYLLLCIVMLTSFSAFAGWSLKNEKGLNDLMYLPNSASVYGVTGVYWGQEEAEVGSVKVNRFETVTRQLVGYGVTDNLCLSVGLGYIISGKTKVTQTSTDTVLNTKFKGLEDPSASLKYRFLNQDSSIFSADLSLVLSPSLGKAKSASTTTDGNAYRGGSLYSAGIDFGKKYTDMSWKISVGLDMYGKQTNTDDSIPVETTTVNARTDVNVGFSWQWVTSPSFALNLNTGLGLVAEMNSTYPLSDLEEKIDSNNAFILGTDLIFNVDKNFSINLGISGKSFSETNIKTTEISTGLYDTVIAKNYTEGLFSVAAKYEF